MNMSVDQLLLLDQEMCSLLFERGYNMKISQNLAKVAHTTTLTATMIPLEQEAVSMQSDVIDVPLVR